MTLKTRLIVASIVNILIYIVFFKFLPYWDDKYHGCYIHEDIYKQHIKSIVLGKYIDNKNHDNKTIIIGKSKKDNDSDNSMMYQKENKENEIMIFPGYLEDMYEYLNIGDSIIKEKGSIYYRWYPNRQVKIQYLNLKLLVEIA